MKIVLANTVGIDSEGWSIIPYPSRWTTASLGHEDGYTFYPRDLAYLCSLLKRDTGHDVKLIDGCLARYNREEYAEVLIEEAPDWLVMENSTRTFKEDEWIARKVAVATGAKTVMTGQHASAFPDEALEFADLVAQGEYLQTLTDFFAGGATRRGLIPFDVANTIDVATLPFPEDDDVSRYDYAFKLDLVCEYPEIQIYATRGCPFPCVYCVARHTYYGGPQYRKRPVEDVIAEIRHLVAKYPAIEGFFFDDEIHNADIEYTKDLCWAIIDAGLDDYKYDAMCAYGSFDEEALLLMKRAGYYKVRVGVETASDMVAKGLALGGKHRPDRFAKFLTMAREIGIKVYATFTLGGKGSTADEDIKTVQLMSDILREGLIYDCQLSICTPQPGTPFFDWAKANGALDSLHWRRFDGGEDAVISLPGYDGSAILEMRKYALEEYDKARMERDSALFDIDWPKQVEALGESPSRLLVFRSSRKWHLDNSLQSIFGSWDCEVGFVCQINSIAKYNDAFPGLILFPVNDPGFLNWSKFSLVRQEDILNFHPDIALIPCNTLHCRSMGNVVRIARKSGARRVIFINACGEFIEASKIYPEA